MMDQKLILLATIFIVFLSESSAFIVEDALATLEDDLDRCPCKSKVRSYFVL